MPLSLVLAADYSGYSPSVLVMGTPAPQIDLANLDPGGPAISTTNFDGSAVVVNFWGSWCPPCRGEMPTLQAVHRELANRVTFIGIDEHDSRQAAISFARSVGVTYTNGFDPSGAAARSFRLDGTPTTYFMSDGRELYYTLGAVTKKGLLKRIRELFGVS